LSFVHLHTHSEFSLLDGANRLEDLVRKAKEFEMPALALTDHGCLFGAWSFQKVARREGIKPILGMEAYVAPGDRRDRSRSGQGERAYYHLVLLARDLQGYRNLVKLSSIGYMEGFYHRPRVDREVLARHREGIIVSSACMAGEVARHLLADDWDGAREAARWYADVFDGRYYLEVQAHDSQGQAELNERIFKLADELGLPVVATNDCHFLQPKDHEAHDILLCIGLGKDRDDPARMRYDKGLYFKSAPEIAERFPDRPDVLENTLLIGDQVDLALEKKYHLPAFPLPAGHGDENDYLEHLALEGAHERYGNPLPPHVQERFDYEIGVIKGTGYAGYFLIVHDFISWARRRDIPVGPGRGSAAGSLVAYSLGITNLDPLRHDLLFERFLNPERISMPDIDIDFCFERRGEVIEYVRQKYGKDAVGQIVTFGTMKSRAVIRDVGRTLGFEPAETDRIAKLIPNAPGQSFTVEEAVKGLKEVRALYNQDERHRQLFDYSMTLEGLSRHASVHAAGVVIAPGPLDDYVPVCIQTGKNGGDGDDAMAVTQYDMNCLDEAGMLKMDFLGLKTLTVIHDAVVMVKARYGQLKNPDTGEVYASMDDVPLDDPAVYRMLARGGTSGVFQFESNLANDKLRAMRCDRFDDLVATNALIRPGPLDSGMADVYIDRKLGRKPVSYPHPALKATLEPTYGVIVYQEQLMRIANVLAKYSLGEADVLRKAVGKKDADLIRKELAKFVERAVSHGTERRLATDLAEQIETFGRYGFNKCLPAHVEVLDAASGRMVRIGDVFEGRERLRSVLACDTGSLRFVEAGVTDVIDNGVRPVWRLKTESGREIDATANHPFFTLRGWRALADVAPGEHVAVPRSLQVEGSGVWRRHEVIALGHLLAEGNLCHPTGLYFYSQDETEIADFIAAAEAFPNVRCTLDTHRGTGSVYTARADRREPNGILEWAGALGLLGKTATEKEVPASAFEMANEQIALLLSRMWAGDGHISLKKRAIYYATSSKRLAHQVQHLLLRLGILSRVREVRFPYRGTSRIGWQIHVHGNEHYRTFLDSIGRHFVSPARVGRLRELVLDAPRSGPSKDLVPVAVRGRIRALKEDRSLRWVEVEVGAGVSSRDLYPQGTNPEKVGFTRSFVGRLAEYFGDTELRALAAGEVLWDRVAQIEPLGNMRTFDLEVAGHHNFVANDILVHNSHSAAYSLVAYHTAWLKAHYPAEFMAALLSSVLDKTDDVVKYIGECRDLQRYIPKLEEPVEVLPPDVNQSGWKFVVTDVHQIRFGLGAVRGVGAGAVKSILEARESGGPFRSLFDFLERIDTRALNKRACEALIAAGALDAFGHRAQLLAGLDAAYAEVQARQVERDAGQASLFGEASLLPRVEPALPRVPVWDEPERLAREKEALGFFISGHPLDRYREVVRAFEPVNSATLSSYPGQGVELACVVTSVARQISRKDNSEWGKITVEDFQGTATILAFRDAWQAYKDVLKQDAVVLVSGKVSSRERDEEDPPIFLDSARALDDVAASGEIALQIELELGGALPEEAFAEARKVLAAHPGPAPVWLQVGAENGARAPRLRSRSLRASADAETVGALQKLFGRGNVRLVRVAPPPPAGQGW
jgi:DNA polymerase-3 subunit alpha